MPQPPREPATYKVIVDDSELFSVWPAEQTPPPGWQETATWGTIQECMAHLAEVWADRGPHCPRTEFVEPRTALEEELSRLWQELLAVERVGIHHSFFALGGHSLKVVELAAWVREAFSVDIPIQFLFEQPTIAGLALEITRRWEEL